MEGSPPLPRILLATACSCVTLRWIAANNNRSPAGELREDVLTIPLELGEGQWHPESKKGEVLTVYAIGETGRSLQNPGPLIQVRRNSLGSRAALTFALVCLFSHACMGQERISGTEKTLFDSVNRERAARELPVLKWDESLARAARKHAELMAEENLLLHRLPGEANLATRAREAGASFSHITENIGMAVYADGFHDGWMHSPGHRANILDATIDSIGIAVVEGGEQLFAVEDFARVVMLLSIEEQEKRIGKLIAAHGLRLLKIGDDARKSCELGREYAGSGKPRYIANYETPNISQLPEGLEKELQSGRYKAAAVVACPQRKSSDSAPFRIVVMLH